MKTAASHKVLNLLVGVTKLTHLFLFKVGAKNIPQLLINAQDALFAA